MLARASPATSRQTAGFSEGNALLHHELIPPVSSRNSGSCLVPLRSRIPPRRPPCRTARSPPRRRQRHGPPHVVCRDPTPADTASAARSSTRRSRRHGPPRVVHRDPPRGHGVGPLTHQRADDRARASSCRVQGTAPGGHGVELLDHQRAEDWRSACTLMIALAGGRPLDAPRPHCPPVPRGGQ